MLIQAYVVRETEKALGVVMRAQAHVKGVRPLWLPKAKIADWCSIEGDDKMIATANDGLRRGNLMEFDVADDFAAKVFMVVEV